METPAGRKALYFALAILGLILGANALVAPLVYYAEPFHGRVIDAQTLEPIPGAIVGARWVLWVIWVGNREVLSEAQTVTDLNGNYTIPGRLMLRWQPLGWLDESDPAMVVFKAGYKAEFLTNDVGRNGWVRRSLWNGVEIELYRFQGTPRARVDQLSSVTDYCGRSKSCYEEILKERAFCGAVDPSFFNYIERLMNENYIERLMNEVK
jgi:hypothetical protein